ncbi:histidine kinase [Streptomyces sp. NPDC060010]|uniref:sensor histidine kinase n=1 Tax=Streptomyces sp. NPDC060010 TaxID=3347036 RepID=UPI00368D93BF
MIRRGKTAAADRREGRRRTSTMALDVLLWMVLTGAAVTRYRDDAGVWSPVPVLLLSSGVLAVASAVSRRRPGAAVFLANALCALGLFDPGTPANAYLLALAVLSGLLGVRSSGAGPALLVFGACMALDLGLCAALRVGAVHWFYVVTLLPGAMLLPWAAGWYWRARQEFVRGGWRRARRLESGQRDVAERARLRERTRISADMHDSLGHELSLIALRAGALELSPTLTDRDREDVARLRASVADAVEHLRDTIGVLREGADAERSASTTGAVTSPESAESGDSGDSGNSVESVESVEQLVGRVRATGVAVELRRDGEVSTLPPLVDRTVYRVVRESLTNAIRHAPGSTVDVRVARTGGRVEVRVVNSAPPGRAPTREGAGRHGLVGLRERVRMIGGTLRAAPGRGGFEVVADLPDRVGAERRTAVAEPGGEESESVRGLVAARRSARVRFALAFGVPAGIGLTMALSAAVLAVQLAGCVLRPADFAALTLGSSRAEHADVLPARTFRYPSDPMRAQPAPVGADCAFYRSNGNLLEQVDVYRLCWSGSRLVAKDVWSGVASAQHRPAGQMGGERP